MALFDQKSLMRALGPRVMWKALTSFDRHMTSIVLSSWLAAIMAILLALYTVWLAGSNKQKIAAAEALEPSLPQIAKVIVSADDLKPFADRLQKQFPELTITANSDQTLSILSNAGGLYKTWLTAVSFADTLSPQYRWSIKELCVGMGCAGNALMTAKLAAEKVTFSAPQAD